MAQNHPDEAARLRRILPDRAIGLAMQSRWAEAVDVNKAILAMDPNDADAHNRLGKAHLELGNYRDAYEAYKRAVELAPGNAIAQKNMNRLAPLAQQAAPAAGPRPAPRPAERINPHTFIEETGKTGLTHLHSVANAQTLLTLTAGDRVVLASEEGRLQVRTTSGEYLGQVDPKMAQRLLRFIQAGNRYTAAVTTVNDKSLSVLIREEYQDPSMIGRQSFPSKGATAAYRATSGASRYNYDEDEDSGGEFDGDAESETETEESEDDGDFDEEEIDDRE